MIHKKEYSIAFIIPALNEQENIGKTLTSIKHTMGESPHEIIVSDNGSIDRTCEIAKRFGAKVIPDPAATIAELRNLGVKNSSSEILAFIDADVTLAADWHKNLKMYLPTWPTDGLIVSGSRCAVPDTEGFFAMHWFNHLSLTKTRYINSGHMITTRILHNAISGFDESLKTSEDVDYCQRAINIGAVISQSTELTAYHSGYPTTALAFIKREAWHGREDISSIRNLLNSKVALAAIVNSIFILSFIPIGFWLKSHWALMAPLLLTTSFSTFLTYLKFGKLNTKDFILTSVCFQFYLIGRGLSLLNINRK